MIKIKLNNEEIDCEITNVTDITVEITVKKPSKQLYEHIAYYKVSQYDILFEINSAQQYVRVIDTQMQAKESMITLIFTLVALK